MIGATVGIVAISSIIASVVIRVPALWRLVPIQWASELVSMSAIHSQEAAANFEFLVVWLFCFAATCALGGALLAVVWKNHRGNSDTE